MNRRMNVLDEEKRNRMRKLVRHTKEVYEGITDAGLHMVWCSRILTQKEWGVAPGNPHLLWFRSWVQLCLELATCTARNAKMGNPRGGASRIRPMVDAGLNALWVLQATWEDLNDPDAGFKRFRQQGSIEKPKDLPKLTDCAWEVILPKVTPTDGQRRIQEETMHGKRLGVANTWSDDGCGDERLKAALEAGVAAQAADVASAMALAQLEQVRGERAKITLLIRELVRWSRSRIPLGEEQTDAKTRKMNEIIKRLAEALDEEERNWT